MKPLLLIIGLFCGMNVKAQLWHSATDSLKEPKFNGYHTTEWYQSEYRLLPVRYVLLNGKRGKGYKKIYIHNGYITDNENTVGVFFRNRKKRIFCVDKYFFN